MDTTPKDLADFRRAVEALQKLSDTETLLLFDVVANTRTALAQMEHFYDRQALDRFHRLMITKMASARAFDGQSYWQSYNLDFLQRELLSHVIKGDPIAVAIFAMMLQANFSNDPAVFLQDQALRKQRAQLMVEMGQAYLDITE